MLFQKTIEKRCAYCERGALLDETSVLCKKKGIVSAGDQCRAFRYDPFKRTPPKPIIPDFSRLKEEDFVL